MTEVNFKIKIPDEYYEKLDKTSLHALNKAMRNFAESWFMWWMNEYCDESRG